MSSWNSRTTVATNSPQTNHSPTGTSSFRQWVELDKMNQPRVEIYLLTNRIVWAARLKSVKL